MITMLLCRAPRFTRLSVWLSALAILLVCAPPARAAQPLSSDEKEALAELARQIDGALIFTERGRVKKVVIGDDQVTDLGPGEYARWSRDGKHIAVFVEGKPDRIDVMDADGGRRRTLYEGAEGGNGCPIDFHPNNREILFYHRDGFHTVSLETGQARKVELPAKYNGEPAFSDDGKRLACRWGGDLYAVDLAAGKHRKYAGGCSAGVSPDGQWLMRNLGDHRQLAIEAWAGGGEFRLDTKTCLPDGSWDNHHWSNHNDFIAAGGDGRYRFPYVVQVSKNRATLVAREAGEYPDLWIDSADTQSKN
jgi:hypothetical protein